MMDYTLFGESHGEAVGVLLKNVPAGMIVDHAFIAAELLRRAPRDALTTSRHEEDEVEFLSGVFAGKTTGMPLVAIIRNRDGNSADYESLQPASRRELQTTTSLSLGRAFGSAARRTIAAADTFRDA